MGLAPTTYRPDHEVLGDASNADLVTTEVIRHGLIAAADAIKTTLTRTSMSPALYEILDFAAGLYDRQVRMLAQAPTLPQFMGTMSFCVEAAIEAVGGEEALEPGDIVLINDPHKTGAHPQDTAMVMPVFMSDGILVGYAAVKAHWADIGAKNSYCTDTTDVFQEGIIFPGVKLYRRGRVVEDIVRMATANSRLPRFVEGDINASVAAIRTGAAQLVRLVDRYGLETFLDCVERMYDHGEAVARSYLETLPAGRYVGRGELDSDGIGDEPIPFEVALEIDGSDVRVDFSNAPDARVGPVNCPLASTVSSARVIITMLAGGGDAPNEGHFRPIEVITRPGSIFHALPPSASFLYFKPAMQATEVILQALAETAPGDVPACSGGDTCGIHWYGTRRDTGEYWYGGGPQPVGQGASSRGDGQSARMHHCLARTRFTALEIWEAKYPWVTEQYELATDSGGPGRFSGGLGSVMRFRFLADAAMTCNMERTRNPPWGLAGGLPGRPNAGQLTLPDGTTMPFAKTTGLSVPEGSVVTLRTGGGGGYGVPAERPRDDVLADLEDGYISKELARSHYPHALD